MGNDEPGNEPRTMTEHESQTFLDGAIYGALLGAVATLTALGLWRWFA